MSLYLQNDHCAHAKPKTDVKTFLNDFSNVLSDLFTTNLRNLNRKLCTYNSFRTDLFCLFQIEK